MHKLGTWVLVPLWYPAYATWWAGVWVRHGIDWLVAAVRDEGPLRGEPLVVPLRSGIRRRPRRGPARHSTPRAKLDAVRQGARRRGVSRVRCRRRRRPLSGYGHREVFAKVRA